MVLETLIQLDTLKTRNQMKNDLNHQQDGCHMERSVTEGYITPEPETSVCSAVITHRC